MPTLSNANSLPTYGVYVGRVGVAGGSQLHHAVLQGGQSIKCLLVLWQVTLEGIVLLLKGSHIRLRVHNVGLLQLLTGQLGEVAERLQEARR
jgi:hypothetical protein